MIVIWAVMLSMGIIPVSCDLFCPDSCGCGPSSQFKEFSIKDFAIGDLLIGTSDFNPNFFYEKDQLFKVIEISGFEYLSQIQESKLHFFFINGAYACSPIPPSSIQKIDDLKIINKKEIYLSNNMILKEEEITDRFLISNYPTIAGQTIPSFLENDHRIFMGEPFYLRWNESIANETELNFDILIKLSDGQEFKFEDEVMKIK